MIVTKLEQWKTEHRLQFRPRTIVRQSHVTEIECVGCHTHFLRWTATAAAYGRCDECTAAS